MSSHWMSRVAKRAGLDGVERLDLDGAATLERAWTETARVCGVTEDELAEAVAAVFHTEVAVLEAAERSATKLIPATVAEKYQLFPIKSDDHHIVIASADPTNVMAEQEAGFTSGRVPLMRIAPPGRVREMIDSAYSPEKAAELLLAKVDEAAGSIVEIVEDRPPEEIGYDEVGAGPIVRLTEMILHEAVERGASDVHMQPGATGGVVRFRIDGVLRRGMHMPLAVLARVVSRIKIMSSLDIADRLRPQDGRARILVEGVKYDLRVSTVPTRTAEKAVIRILDSRQSGTLEETGIGDEEVDRIRRVLGQRDGIFVVTGPTGSGKTTTLYSALRDISTEDVNIMTVEDPVEYELPGLTQIQVEPKRGVTFASALRAILRQDPDVIFVGEIRDGDTAHIAAQASLTGHLVLATLHTNDAVGSVRRFLDLGLDASLIAETLRGATAQRLLREVCSDCAQPAADPLTPEEEHLVELYGVRPTVRAPGCDECSGSGYRGRVPVCEFMPVTGELARLISTGAPPHELHRQARLDGMRTLREVALDLVARGVTTLEEVERVIGDDEEDATPTEDRRRVPRPAAGTEPDRPAPAPPAPELDAAPEEDEIRILLVDDDGANRMIARGLLERQGYTVDEAVDGSEALVRLARGEAFDLVVLDLEMPTLGGRDVLRAIRSSAPTMALPVIVLTGSGLPETEIELLEQGADDYIRKPIDPPRFLTRVRATLRRAGA